MIRKMSKLDSDEISSVKLGDFGAGQSQEIRELQEEYARQAAEIAKAQGAKEGGAAAHKRAIISLEKQYESAAAKVAKGQPIHDDLAAEHEAAVAAAAKALKLSKRIEKEMAKLDVLEGDEANRPALEKLRMLIRQNESLKAKEAAFKKTCMEEMASIEEKIEKIKGAGVEYMDDERASAIAQQREGEVAKLAKIKQISARRNREIALKQRQIDEYPSRSELNQYQRRFVELYGQVSAKLRETKQYYLMYNTLADSKMYFSKEVTLLDSIHDNFEAAMKSKTGKQQLLQQMKQIDQVMTEKKTKVESRQAEEKENRDEMRASYLQLVELERTYHQVQKRPLALAHLAKASCLFGLPALMPCITCRILTRECRWLGSRLIRLFWWGDRLLKTMRQNVERMKHYWNDLNP